MSTIRVYELAKELTTEQQKVSVADIQRVASTLNIHLENHLAQVQEDQAAQIRKAMKAQSAGDGTETRVRSGLVRRRKTGADSAPEAETPKTAADSLSAEESLRPKVIRRQRKLEEPADVQGEESPVPSEDKGAAVPEPPETPVAVEAVPEEAPVPGMDPNLLSDDGPKAEGDAEPSVATEVARDDAKADGGGEVVPFPAPDTELPAPAPVSGEAAAAMDAVSISADKPSVSAPPDAGVPAAVDGEQVGSSALVEETTDSDAMAPTAGRPAGPGELPRVPDRNVSRATHVDGSPNEPPAATPLQLTLRTKKPRIDPFKAVVVSMPDKPPPEAAKPKVVLAAPRISERVLDQEEKKDRGAKKGKKLIYDRRKEPAGGRFGNAVAGRGRKKRKGRAEPVVPPMEQRRVIRIQETITVSELSAQMFVKANIVLKKMVEQGIMATVNDALDFETAAIIATDLGYEVESVAFSVDEFIGAEPDLDDELVFRPPVVTIMGHVDHGKTSLLDRIQQSTIASGEAGGITQRIGAYVVNIDKGTIVFIDTPGHEAFTAMRARGAMVTDIVILVVAADDGVMPQTLEAISHAKAANVPIIVAVNKIDKPDGDPQRVRRELADHDLAPEEWGGTTIFVDVSATQGTGVDALLDMMLLQAEMLELTANPDKRARGIIIESRLEKGRGPVASVIVQEGTLKVGDFLVAGQAVGRIRALMNDRGQSVREIGPSFPAEILGLDQVPMAGEEAIVVKDEKIARTVADFRIKKEREEKIARHKRPTFEQLISQMGTEEKRILKVVLKADTQGAVDAIHQGMEQVATERVGLEVIHEGVGNISENDVNLALASGGLVLGFNVKPDPIARSFADSHDVQILLFNLIHELVDKTRLLMEGKLDMIEQENFLGRAEIRQIFSISRLGKIAGCMVQEGKISRSAQVRLLRGGQIQFKGKLASLKRFKEDVREVQQGFECGMNLDGHDDLREGDLIECFEIVKIAASLDG
jgi:translation initiation factor IF-2